MLSDDDYDPYIQSESDSDDEDCLPSDVTTTDSDTYSFDHSRKEQ